MAPRRDEMQQRLSAAVGAPGLGQGRPGRGPRCHRSRRGHRLLRRRPGGDGVSPARKLPGRHRPGSRSRRPGQPRPEARRPRPSPATLAGRREGRRRPQPATPPRRCARPTARRRPDGSRRPGPAGRVGDPPTGAPGPKGLGGDQVEGRQAVRELLLAGTRKVREVWVAGDQDDAVGARRHRRPGPERGRAVHDVSRAKLPRGPHRGAPGGAGRAAPLPETDLDDLSPPEGGRGAVPAGRRRRHRSRQPRCAAAVGRVRGRDRGGAAPSPGGAHHPDRHQGGRRGGRVPADGPRRWAADRHRAPEGGRRLGGRPRRRRRRRPFDLRCPATAMRLVLGAEGAGLSRLVRQRCDVVASIPLGGGSARSTWPPAGAVACFEIARRRPLR